MSPSFTIIVNESRPDAWPDIVWRDASSAGARVLLDSCRPLPALLRKLRKAHFANPANRRVWLPMKCLWDGTNALRLSDLDPSRRNYVIFQTGIKFSAHFIQRLKRERNACIVLYMPDNIRTMKMAQSREEFLRFCRHYHVDQAYSFDRHDCEEFGLEFFDFYSKLPVPQEAAGAKDGGEDGSLHADGKPRILYVGSCRSKDRLDTLHALYDKLNSQAHCTFYLNGVAQEDATRPGIVYNHPLSYAEVVGLVQQHDIIVEIMNGTQTGNTLRLKEAVCYNKCLLTNNTTVISSPYYNSGYMQIFDKVENIDLSLFSYSVDYRYQGEFSPCKLMERIRERDMLNF